MSLLQRIHCTLTLIAMMVAVYAIFVHAPVELTMGIVQKIFYFHVAAAWVGFLGIYVVCFCSVLFLINYNRQWDLRAASAAEVGAVFFFLNLVSGPIWAKPVWGIWWTWDARLTSSVIFLLIYLGYLLLRVVVESPEKRATLCAVVSMFGALHAIVVYISNRLPRLRTQHPQPVIGGGPDSGLHPDMQLALLVTLIAFTLLFLYLWRIRIDLEKSREAVERLVRNASLHFKFQNEEDLNKHSTDPKINLSETP